MKNIIIVTGSLGAGGIEKVTSRIANYYIERGYKVTICCLLEGEEKVFVQLNDKIEILFFNKIKDNSKLKILMTFKWIKYLRGIFKEKKPDCVLAMTLKIGALCVLARKKTKIRVSFRETCDPKSNVRNVCLDRILCFICRKIDGIIFQTEWEKSCYPAFMQKKGKVIPNPVSVDVSWDNCPDNKVIVTMGRLENIQKRHDVLIEAFHLFVKNNPGYKLIIYGDGPDRIKEENYIKKYNLESNVILAGAKKNVHELISRASMFIMTSDFEGLSNALVEALLIGLPCISSNWHGCDEIITHNVNGFIYERQNVDELVTYMNEIANNMEKRIMFSNEAKKLKEHFDPSNIIREYANIIEGIDT